MARTERQEVLERFLLGFEGSSLPDELASLLSQGLAGVALYSRNFFQGSSQSSPHDSSPNVTDIAGLCALTDSIRQAAGQPVIIGIDQEGGTRFSLGTPFTAWPSPAELGRLGDATITEKVAQAMARELLAVGCDLNFSPMLDLATNPNSPVTKGRSFGNDPREVARLGVAFLQGLAAGGVLSCAKHFPGHGDTDVDPHLDLPRFGGTTQRLAENELVPFAAAIGAGVPLIMTAHILLPKVDPAWPASLSRRVLADLLRRDMRFDGVILADDLGMGAINKRYGAGDSVVKALDAGTDIAMLCHNWDAVPAAIAATTDAVTRGAFDPAEWSAGRKRIARLRERIGGLALQQTPPLESVGCAEHRELADEVRARLSQHPR